MKIAIASDHDGFELKEILKSLISGLGHEVTDLGTNSASKPVDYPDFVAKAASEITSGHARRALMVCGSGVGACVAANTFPGVRAGLFHNTDSARQGVEHDNINFLCLGARVIGAKLASDVTRAYLSAKFSGAESR
ncbi:MAG: RpiB/LacA/LacB family sugar-phosphate isomerase [Elusimicrobia bacterium]|nr:RpiB/LacA/LacB family sugar-phosphate isomerase [Elusimicrobiota bacterium]